MSRTKQVKLSFEKWAAQPDVKARFTVLPAVVVAEVIKSKGIDLNKARADAMREVYEQEYGESGE